MRRNFDRVVATVPVNTKRGFVRCEADARRDAEALRLRSNGLTYDAIGQKMACHKATALRRCERALIEIPREEAENYRKLEDLRLDEMSMVLWPLVESGSLQAIDRLLAISKRRAKLWGLDAPTSTRRSNSFRRPTASDLDRRVEELRSTFERGFEASIN